MEEGTQLLEVELGLEPRGQSLQMTVSEFLDDMTLDKGLPLPLYRWSPHLCDRDMPGTTSPGSPVSIYSGSWPQTIRPRDLHYTLNVWHSVDTQCMFGEGTNEWTKK